MGLDISVHQGPLVLVSRLATDESAGDLIEQYYDEGKSVFRAWNDPAFTDRCELPEGVYESVLDWHFRAGSYSGYNRYREAVCELALGTTPETVWYNKTKYEGQPFFEQISFSDCEGVLGPKVCAKLAQDYAEWEDRARDAWGVDSYHFEKYLTWRKAFEDTADNGCVVFS